MGTCSSAKRKKKSISYDLVPVSKVIIFQVLRRVKWGLLQNLTQDRQQYQRRKESQLLKGTSSCGQLNIYHINNEKLPNVGEKKKKKKRQFAELTTSVETIV